MAQNITIRDVYSELKRMERTMVTKKELNKLFETMEIASNPRTMSMINKSEADIKAGRVRNIHSVKDMLDE